MNQDLQEIKNIVMELATKTMLGDDDLNPLIEIFEINCALIKQKLESFDELETKGFTTIDTRDNGFYHTVKYLDVTEFSLGYCYNCEDFQPMNFEAQEQIKGKQNGGIHVTCDECRKYHRSWDLSHMNNDRS